MIEDVERDKRAIFGGGDESGVIVDAEVVLEPQDGRAAGVGRCHFGSERETTAWGSRGKGRVWLEGK